MLFCTAFLVQFLLAGLTGIMFSVAPWNWNYNSYFVIARFHYVLVGAMVFSFFGGFYYWFPKMTGKMLDERLGKWHFWLFFIGFHLCFDLMHIPGLLGMPRSIYTYEPGRGWDNWNMIVSIGGLIQGVATLIFAYNMVYSYFKGPERPGPLGCLDARVGNLIAAARVQLCQRAGGGQPQTVVGPEAPGRSGLPVRMILIVEEYRG